MARQLGKLGAAGAGRTQALGERALACGTAGALQARGRAGCAAGAAGARAAIRPCWPATW